MVGVDYAGSVARQFIVCLTPAARSRCASSDLTKPDDIIVGRTNYSSQHSSPGVQCLAHFIDIVVLVIDAGQSLPSMADHHFGYRLRDAQSRKFRSNSAANVVGDPSGRLGAELLSNERIQLILRLGEALNRVNAIGGREKMIPPFERRQ
jgi:hypothetical protein